jgi:hypothetical protein
VDTENARRVFRAKTNKHPFQIFQFHLLQIANGGEVSVHLDDFESCWCVFLSVSTSAVFTLNYSMTVLSYITPISRFFRRIPNCLTELLRPLHLDLRGNSISQCITSTRDAQATSKDCIQHLQLQDLQYRHLSPRNLHSGLHSVNPSLSSMISSSLCTHRLRKLSWMASAFYIMHLSASGLIERAYWLSGSLRIPVLVFS